MITTSLTSAKVAAPTQGVLCNCTLHLANLGDCRAVGAFRDVVWKESEKWRV